MQESKTQLITKLIEAIGDDPIREGLIDTPDRVIRSWEELFAGYKQNPKDILSKTFESNGYNDIVLLKDIEFTSFCEHHLLPFTGICHIAYIPSRRVVGISKLARLVDCFAKRLQIQENLTNQIAQAIEEFLNPVGVVVIIQSKHDCVGCRGVRKNTAKMVTRRVIGNIDVNDVLTLI
jgi:GTP cyclohydrolase I